VDSPLTFGVEEEFLLLDAVTGRPVSVAPEMLRLLRGEPGLQAELMRYQFETATRVCSSAGELRAELMRLRRLGSAGARVLGCRLVSSGMPPYGSPGLSALTDRSRYRELARRFPALTAAFGTCGCHVHVGVPSRDCGVRILTRLRPWLATLLAISANSPIENGRDTGWASRRYGVVARWPTGRPPAVWADAAGYDRTIRRFIQRGASVDERSVYLLARLSSRYPTVEIRVADVCPDVDMTMLVAVLVRGLVATAAAEIRAGKPIPGVSEATVVAGLAAAARHGLDGDGVDPFTGRPAGQWSLVHRLMEHVDAALDDLDDRAGAAGLLALLRSRGTGAQRQRALWSRAGSAADWVDALAEMTFTAPPAAAGSLDAERAFLR